MARRSLKYLLNRYTLSFRNRIVVIAVGMVICLLSLVYTNRMAPVSYPHLLLMVLRIVRKSFRR